MLQPCSSLRLNAYWLSLMKWWITHLVTSVAVCDSWVSMVSGFLLTCGLLCYALALLSLPSPTSCSQVWPEGFPSILTGASKEVSVTSFFCSSSFHGATLNSWERVSFCGLFFFFLCAFYFLLTSLPLVHLSLVSQLYPSVSGSRSKVQEWIHS